MNSPENIERDAIGQYNFFVCFIYLSFCFGFFFGGGRVSLCSSGHIETNCVDQTSLKLKDLPVSVSQMLEFEVCATTT